jgi:hypothetical protein
MSFGLAVAFPFVFRAMILAIGFFINFFAFFFQGEEFRLYVGQNWFDYANSIKILSIGIFEW